jgi:hypothetical protein
MECPTCYSQRRIKRGTVQDADGVHPCTDPFHDKGSRSKSSDEGEIDERQVAADFETAKKRKAKG